MNARELNEILTNQAKHEYLLVNINELNEHELNEHKLNEHELNEPSSSLIQP